ncbi:potassium voltage-gated channel protein Shal-like [Actinia tenebrosa]|uniref:Potassium voltage-gated channel protein Shal-like n=1 Tax=Actinia tenebrosa TaxID=6105 RepID=A0A6P8HWP6_ACTTE|nr:potassium voltage-gated channel protein Shal-like [Actinia tenebrosa]
MDRLSELNPSKQNHTKSPKTQRKAVFRLGGIVSAPGVHTSLKNLQTISKYDHRLRFNVGGTYFEILKENLARFPDTLLGGNRKTQFFDEKRNEFFFDRDPIMFKYILDFYRTGKFHISTPDCMESISDELAFFGIPESFVSECCCEYINFENNLEEERIHIQKKAPDAFGGREKLHEFLTDFKSSLAAAIFSYFFVLVVVINICIIVGETLECALNRKCGDYFEAEFFCVDSFCVAVFTLEFFSRLFSCPDRREFIKDFSNIVDLIGILPYYFGIMERLIETNNTALQSIITILRIFRIFRVIKLARHSEQFQTLLLSIGQAAGELGGILFSFLALMVMFSTLIFVAEDGGSENLNGFTSIPAAFWYTLVTMTTLGYGDIYPGTFFGKVIGSACALAGVVLLALPVPIIEERLNANSKKASRNKDEKPFEGLTKRFATSIASLSRLKNFKKFAGLTSHASQSSAIDLSCNDRYESNHVTQEMKSSLEKSTDFPSDETIKATFVEMSEAQPVQIHQCCVHGRSRFSPTRQYPGTPDQGNNFWFSNRNLSARSSSEAQREDSSMKPTSNGYAVAERKPCARKRRGYDSANGDHESISLKSFQENGTSLQTADQQNDSETEEQDNEDYDQLSDEWNTPI